MHRHRIAPDEEYYRLPAALPMAAPPEGFVVWTLPANEAGSRTAAIYAQAWQRTVTDLQPSILERELFASPN